jgi:hypothetical protein
LEITIKPTQLSNKQHAFLNLNKLLLIHDTLFSKKCCEKIEATTALEQQKFEQAAIFHDPSLTTLISSKGYGFKKSSQNAKLQHYNILQSKSSFHHLKIQ